MKYSPEVRRLSVAKRKGAQAIKAAIIIRICFIWAALVRFVVSVTGITESGLIMEGIEFGRAQRRGSIINDYKL